MRIVIKPNVEVSHEKYTLCGCSDGRDIYINFGSAQHPASTIILDEERG